MRGVGLDDGEHVPLHGVDLSVEAGDRVVVFGGSGSGKRTLLKLAAGILVPETGSVTLSGAGPIPLGFVSMEGGLLGNLTLLDNSILPLLYHQLRGGRAAAKARALFSELGIAQFADRRPAEAGYGARRLAQLARALLCEPPLFVLEEPLAEIDAAAARSVRSLLDRLDGAVIVVTGSLGQYLDWGRRFLFLHEGRGVLFESAQALRAAKAPEVRACLD